MDLANKGHRPKSSETVCRILIVAVLFLLDLMFSGRSISADLAEVEAVRARKLEIVSGKSIILKSPLAVQRVSVAAPDIADFLLISPKEIYLTGKAAGTTNLTLWQDSEVAAIYDLEVTYDLSRLKRQIYELLPEERDLNVISTNDSITLSGRVSSVECLSQAVALAKAYAPEGKINNLVKVGGIQQVMLEVRVAEMARSVTKRLGINFTGINGESFGVSLLNKLTELVRPIDANFDSGGPFVLRVTPTVNALFRFRAGRITCTGFVDALQGDGLAKVLAEPTLIALSGEQAKFLAGGEFPVPIPQGLGTVAIEYKPFGVGLTFSPTVLRQDRISIKVAPEVSELDFTTAIQVSGFVIPGLTTRRAATTVELNDGQSFAIAGLLRENIVEDIQKFPLLGDIPILGALFRSESFRKSETELVIIVTPHLVKPLDMNKQTLPTDFYVEPSNSEFYLEGLVVGRDGQKPPLSGGVEGEFGHAVK